MFEWLWPSTKPSQDDVAKPLPDSQRISTSVPSAKQGRTKSLIHSRRIASNSRTKVKRTQSIYAIASAKSQKHTNTSTSTPKSRPARPKMRKHTPSLSYPHVAAVNIPTSIPLDQMSSAERERFIFERELARMKRIKKYREAMLSITPDDASGSDHDTVEDHDTDSSDNSDDDDNDTNAETPRHPRSVEAHNAPLDAKTYNTAPVTSPKRVSSPSSTQRSSSSNISRQLSFNSMVEIDRQWIRFEYLRAGLLPPFNTQPKTDYETQPPAAKHARTIRLHRMNPSPERRSLSKPKSVLEKREQEEDALRRLRAAHARGEAQRKAEEDARLAREAAERKKQEERQLQVRCRQLDWQYLLVERMEEEQMRASEVHLYQETLLNEFARYEEKWRALKGPISGLQVSSSEFPWPVLVADAANVSCPADIDLPHVLNFVLHPLRPDAVVWDALSRQKLLSNELKEWDPIHFVAAVLPLVFHGEQAMVARGAERVICILKAVLETEQELYGDLLGYAR